MAYDILSKDSPDALNKANEVLKTLAGDKLTVNEKDYPFVEGSIFADYIKYHGGAW
jgi:hypothetical protein